MTLKDVIDTWFRFPEHESRVLVEVINVDTSNSIVFSGTLSKLREQYNKKQPISKDSMMLANDCTVVEILRNSTLFYLYLHYLILIHII